MMGRELTPVDSSRRVVSGPLSANDRSPNLGINYNKRKEITTNQINPYHSQHDNVML